MRTKNLYLEICLRNTGKKEENTGKVREFYQSEKVGTLFEHCYVIIFESLLLAGRVYS